MIPVVFLALWSRMLEGMITLHIPFSKRCTILLILFLWPGLSIAQNFTPVDPILTIAPIPLCSNAHQIRYQNPDSAIYLFQQCLDQLIRQQDTTKAIYTLTEISEIHSHQARYKESYDNLWAALRLADESDNLVAKAFIYARIGRLYSYYRREEETLAYLQRALGMAKAFVADELFPYYSSITSTYRELGKPTLANAYLDSGIMVYSPTKNQYADGFIQFERASILAQTGDYSQALTLLHEIHDWFVEKRPSYLVLVYTTMGDLHKELEQYAKSKPYYQRALQVSAEYHSHVDFTPIVHQKLAEIYLLTGNYSQAYESLQHAKELDERFFDSRAKNNLPLLKIQDAFRTEQVKQEALLRKQRLAELEHKDSVWLLQKIIFVVSIISILLIGFLYFNYVRAKHRTEKQLIKKKQELEKQKANEVVEIKNKELIASAVQVIERDELLSDLKDKLIQQKKEPDPSELGKLVKSIELSTSKDWEEFETPFIAVNKSFYDRLEGKFPTLSQNDHKICALIKLNFSSKEMAKLLGISIESVHTTRYRLRKKLGLERKTNLENYIAKI